MPSTLRAIGHKRMRIKQADLSQKSATPKRKGFTKPRKRMARYLHRPTSTLAISMRKTKAILLPHLMKTLRSQSKLPLPSERRPQRMR